MSIAAPDYLHEADMGFTRNELLSGLANAVSPYTVLTLEAAIILIEGQGRQVQLHTGADRIRAIASMRVPCLAVKLEFFGFDIEQYQAFMLRFKKSLHKGGG